MNIYEEINTLALRAEKAEAALAATRAELDRCLTLAVEERRDAAALQTPCVWRVEAPAHFVGHMDDRPLEMILVATSCGKELGVQLPPPYCAYCGHPVEVLP